MMMKCGHSGAMDFMVVNVDVIFLVRQLCAEDVYDSFVVNVNC